MHNQFVYGVFSCFFFFPLILPQQGTTMLLPSSASNPANMVAQALTMYKSLIGNVPRNVLHETRAGTGEDAKGDIYSQEVGDESTNTARTAKTVHREEVKPVFSLQGPEKVE